MYYYLFNKYGHFDCRMTTAPAILPNGWFVVQGGAVDGKYLWSDGAQIHASDEPPPSEHHILGGGGWTLPPNISSLQLAAAKADRLQALNAAAQAYIDAAAETDKLPAFEVQTWALQAVEAKAWAADNAAPTPVLDGIAAARGVPVDKLKEAALRKTLAYEALTAHIAGQRQALQSKIEAAKTQAALDKIVIAFTVPEAV